MARPPLRTLFLMHHSLDASSTVHRWNRDLPPRLTISPGDTVTLELPDSSGGQVRPYWSAADFAARFDPLLVHALVGPIAIDGARPGDTLSIDLLDVRHRGWAWTALIPGLGLLSADFPSHHLFHWTLDGHQTRSMPGTTIDLAPFPGILGVQRAAHGEFRTRAPGPFGGNLDVRHLTAGTRLLLPVEVDGAGFCAGDCHAAQGDGEVCINGMEAPMELTCRLDLIRGSAPSGPQAIFHGPLVPPRHAAGPWTLFIESDENPRTTCQRAVRRAIDHIQRTRGLSPELAYTLCSVVLDLKVSQLVNVPTTTVTAYLPEAIFD